MWQINESGNYLQECYQELLAFRESKGIYALFILYI